jgi:hypothetical protein
LPLLPDVEFEFRNSGQYAQHQLPVAGGRIEATLLQTSEPNTFSCQGGNDVV